jgi:hypothetical protein
MEPPPLPPTFEPEPDVQQEYTGWIDIDGRKWTKESALNVVTLCIGLISQPRVTWDLDYPGATHTVRRGRGFDELRGILERDGLPPHDPGAQNFQATVASDEAVSHRSRQSVSIYAEWISITGLDQPWVERANVQLTDLTKALGLVRPAASPAPPAAPKPRVVTTHRRTIRLPNGLTLTYGKVNTLAGLVAELAKGEATWGFQLADSAVAGRGRDGLAETLNGLRERPRRLWVSSSLATTGGQQLVELDFRARPQFSVASPTRAWVVATEEDLRRQTKDLKTPWRWWRSGLPILLLPLVASLALATTYAPRGSLGELAAALLVTSALGLVIGFSLRRWADEFEREPRIVAESQMPRGLKGEDVWNLVVRLGALVTYIWSGVQLARFALQYFGVLPTP